MAFNLGQFNTEFPLLPEGTYEVYVSEVESKKASTGSPMVVLNYTVRDDVEGQEEYKGQKIRFDNFVAHPNSMFRFSQIGKAIGLSSTKEYESTEELLEDFVNSVKYKPLRIQVKHEKRMKNKEVVLNENGQPLYNAVPKAYYVTQFHDFTDPETKEALKEAGLDDSADNVVDISEDDLPM